MTRHDLDQSTSLSRRRVLLGVACLPFATILGCTMPGDRKAPRRVRLSPAESFPPGVPSVGWTLKVDEPSATLALNTGKIAFTDGAHEIKYLSTGEWTSRAPEMVMELLVESFKNTGKVLSVGDRRARIRPDFVLQTVLRDFQVEETGSDVGTVRVGLEVSLVQHPRRTVLSSLSFSESAEITPLSLDNIISGFNQSLREVMIDTVEWTLKTGAGA